MISSCILQKEKNNIYLRGGEISFNVLYFNRIGSMHKLTSLAILLILFSCAKESLEPVFDSDSSASQTILFPTKGEDDYIVDEEDINSFIRYVSLSEKDLGDFESFDTSSDNGLPVYYTLKFQNGWKIISADKRGPVILGEGKGSFSNNTNPAVNTWMDVLADDIQFRRFKADEYYGNATEDILERESYSQLFWSAINCESSFIVNNKLKAKADRDPLLPSGHYELFSVYYTDDVYENIEHYITDPWKQSSPFNDYCPFKAGLPERCSAGCVAVAAAQVLYYSHYKIGVPTVSPSSGFCYGDENNYIQHFEDYSDTTWNVMGTIRNYAALLVGEVGLRLRMNYGSNGSSADEHDLPDRVFEPCGLSCIFYNGYDSSIVFSSLQSGWPILFSAFRYESLFSWPGHSFLIDGYKSYVRTTHYVYEWVTENPINLAPSASTKAEMPVNPEPYEILSISSPRLVSLRFRWGYDDMEDNGFYAPDGAWSYGNRSPYNILKTMIYGFNAIDND